MNNDDRITELVAAKAAGFRITYKAVGSKYICDIDEDHLWNLNNTYHIIRPREYIIVVPLKSVPYIEEINNNWTRSDFGKRENGNEYILLREVFKEDM